MKKLILGATGAIGSALAKKIVSDGDQVHLVGRDEANLTTLALELDSTFTVCDVLDDNFSEKKTQDRILKIFNNNIDVIISDMAENTTGNKTIDSIRTNSLCSDVINFSLKMSIG